MITLSLEVRPGLRRVYILFLWILASFLQVFSGIRISGSFFVCISLSVDIFKLDLRNVFLFIENPMTIFLLDNSVFLSIIENDGSSIKFIIKLDRGERIQVVIIACSRMLCIDL